VTDVWDAGARVYRKGGCSVVPSAVPDRTAPPVAPRLAPYGSLIGALQQRLTAGRIAACDTSTSPRQAVRREHHRRPLATTVLLDVSRWTRGVLEVSEDAVLVLGEVANALGDEIEVLAFASASAAQCRVWRIKGFREPWAVARDRVGGLPPGGGARLGPALRYATRNLLQTPADRLLCLVVCGGVPDGCDAADQEAVVADARMAVREARAARVTVHAMSADPAAQSWLPHTFGPARADVVSPEALPEALTVTWGRLGG
jgi:nitric oxide reductase activation protein